MNTQRLHDFVCQEWQQAVLPTLKQFITIPNQSPAFDANWQAHGFMEKALQLVVDWCHQQALPNLHIEVLRLPNRTPLLLLDFPGDRPETILLYGHLDKQPEMTGWAEHLGPWLPVQENDRLYGRGGADDGYAVFAVMTAMRALQQAHISHARCLALIECCEESGSPDLPAYLELLGERFGAPDLVIALDSGCGNYEQLWGTTSLRGLINGTLSVQVLTEGVHSGNASGIVPSSFRIIRNLLSRIEDPNTGEILLQALHVTIPKERRNEAQMAAGILGKDVYNEFPFDQTTNPICADATELILNRTWRPALSIIGADGIPSLATAGNVLRPTTSLKLSLRLPPTCDALAGAQVLKETLEQKPPYGASVTFTLQNATTGWNAPIMASWLKDAIAGASKNYFKNEAAYMGEGGTIPFMGMLGAQFPNAQFLITGVLGPKSNAHGPNEFLHIPTAQKITSTIAEVIARHYQN